MTEVPSTIIFPLLENKLKELFYVTDLISYPTFRLSDTLHLAFPLGSVVQEFVNGRLKGLHGAKSSFPHRTDDFFMRQLFFSYWLFYMVQNDESIFPAARERRRSEPFGRKLKF